MLGSDDCGVEQWNDSELKRRLLTVVINRDEQKTKVEGTFPAKTDNNTLADTGGALKSDKRSVVVVERMDKSATINTDNNEPPYQVLNEPPPVAAPRLRTLNTNLQTATAPLSQTLSNAAIRYFDPDVDDKVAINQDSKVVNANSANELGKDEDGKSSPDTKTINSSSPSVSRFSVSSAASDATYTAANEEKKSAQSTIGSPKSTASDGVKLHEVVTPRSLVATDSGGGPDKQTVSKIELERILASDGDLSIASLSSTTSQSSASLRPLSSSVRSSASSSSPSRKKTASEELTPRDQSVLDARQTLERIKAPRTVEFTDPLHHSISRWLHNLLGFTMIATVSIRVQKQIL